MVLCFGFRRETVDNTDIWLLLNSACTESRTSLLHCPRGAGITVWTADHNYQSTSHSTWCCAQQLAGKEEVEIVVVVITVFLGNHYV